MYASREKRLAHGKAYYLAHREGLNAKGREWYWANIEKCRAQGRAYREAHKDELNAKRKAQYAANPEDRKRMGREYYAKNRRQILSNFMKREYGIDREQFDSLLAHQNGVCGICSGTDWGPRGPMVDHDHRPDGKVRGILCHHCNTALGLIRENPKIAKAMIIYLERGNNGKDQGE